MSVQREIRTAVLVLVLFQLATAFGAVGLLSRMSPAIGEVLADNDFTLQAAEEMLVALAEGPDQPASAKAFAAALARAKDNVTEAGEPPILRRIDERSREVFQKRGGAAARAALVDELKTLTEVNRRSMRDARDRATSLGVTGAWAMVALGLVGFGFFIVYARRLRARIGDPLEEIERVVVALQKGDTYRRCVASGPEQIRAIAFGLNELLDRQTARELNAEDDPENDRKALLYFLDQRTEPTLLVDDDGEVLASNAAGAAWLDEHEPSDVSAYCESSPDRVVEMADEGPYLVTIADG